MADANVGIKLELLDLLVHVTINFVRVRPIISSARVKWWVNR